jgi:tRNA 2-(methylsulfanyl)-N6-isopentenyladenosine37 hydroxylase
MLLSATHPGWFEVASRSLPALLSDHLHCERKAAENALSLVRRYSYDTQASLALSRLAHEETSHVIQVAELLAAQGTPPRADSPNLYTRALLDEVRKEEPRRRLDALLVAALIEARSHERLTLLEHGFAATGQSNLARLYGALASAEDRHAELYCTLAARVISQSEATCRLESLAAREAEILAGLPWRSRIH